MKASYKSSYRLVFEECAKRDTAKAHVLKHLKDFGG